ncbi:MAG: hypothetical protein ABSF35_15755 [Polyangia bacterium]
MTKPKARMLNLVEALQSAQRGPVGESWTYLKIDDGGTARIVFVGEPLERTCAWRNNRTVRWQPEYRSEDLKPSLRFAFIVIDVDEMCAKVLDLTSLQFQRIYEALGDKFGDVIVTLKQHGRRNAYNSELKVEEVEELSDNDRDALHAIPRPKLEEIFADFFTGKNG